MRPLVLLLFLPTTLVLAAPTANACHAVWEPPVDLVGSARYYVIHEVDYGGCPHKLTLCVGIWEESNGQAGWQLSDTPVVAVCPYP